MIQRRAGSAAAVIFSARERVFRGERILLSIDRRAGKILSVTHCAALKTLPRGKRYHYENKHQKAMHGGVSYGAGGRGVALFVSVSRIEMQPRSAPCEHYRRGVLRSVVGVGKRVLRKPYPQYFRAWLSYGFSRVYGWSVPVGSGVSLDIREKIPCGKAALRLYRRAFRDFGYRRNAVISDSLSCYEQHRGYAVRIWTACSEIIKSRSEPITCPHSRSTLVLRNKFLARRAFRAMRIGSE